MDRVVQNMINNINDEIYVETGEQLFNRKNVFDVVEDDENDDIITDEITDETNNKRNRLNESSYIHNNFSKTNIDYSHFVCDNSRMDSGYHDMAEFMVEKDYDSLLLQKKNNQQYMTLKNSSKVFMSVYKKFKTIYTAIEVYGCITDHFGIDATEYWNALTEGVQEIIKSSYRNKYGKNVCLDANKRKFKSQGKILKSFKGL